MTATAKRKASEVVDDAVPPTTTAEAATTTTTTTKTTKVVDLIKNLGGYDNMISQGAEGRVFAVTFLGKPAIVKQRFEKTYRHPILDKKLTKSRLNMEARGMMRARKLGVITPTLYYVDTHQAAIYMERVDGASLKELIRAGAMTAEEMRDVGEEIGRVVAAMHDGGLIHGDLTTSNILLRARDRKVVVIDFGLAHNSIIPEDKGVDLYVLERAITVTHRSAAMFEHVMAAYKQHSRQWSASFNKFAEVRMRGRKRSMIG